MTIQNLFIRAEISAQGAELRRFGTGTGLDLLWHGDPNVWPRTSPILFPVVGRCKEDRIRVGGREFLMPKHGLVRDARWELVLASRESCTFALENTVGSLESYPFPFELSITHTLEDWTLRVSTEVVNRGSESMPFALGAHPAFRWPLSPNVPKEAHRIVFERVEEAPVRRLNGEGLLRTETQPSPVRGQVLHLDDSLFEQDALIFDALTSHAVRLEAPGCPALQVDWAGYRQLGLWSKPGANFLCIEPWFGMPSREDEACAFAERPSLFTLEPGKRQAFHWSVTLVGK